MVEAIINALDTKQKGTIIDVLVTGMAGMGKTQVVCKYIEDNKHKHKHIIWMNADNKDTLDSSFLDLAKFCHLIKEDSLDEIAHVTESVYTYFSEQTLFVFDNADEALLLQCSTGEYMYLPNNTASCGNKYIVISQSRKWTTKFKVTVDSFSEDEALMYLDSVIDCTKKEKQDLAASVQYWPLALCLAASYIVLETDNSLGRKCHSDVIQNIQIGSEDLHTHLPQQHEMEPYNASQRSLWQLLKATLQRKIESDLSLTILHILSFSNPDNFPIELLKFDIFTDDQVMKAISILRDNSLLAVGNYNISIHRALQAVIKSSVISDPYLHKHILVLCTESFEKYLIAMNEFESRKTLGNIHMLTFLKHLCDSQVKLQTYAKMARHLFKKLVDSYDLLIHGKEGIFFEKTLLRTKKYLGDDSEETQIMLSTKSNMLQNMGKYEEALMICNLVIVAQTKMLGKDHPDTLTSMHNKALVLNKMGRYFETLNINNYVIDERINKLGKVHPDTLTSISSKALVLGNMGNYDKALSIYNHMLEGQTEKLGREHSDTLTGMHNKTLVLYNMGKYSEALNIYNQVIEVRREKLGKDHLDTLTSTHNKALVLYNMGKFDEALSIYNHVIKVRTEKLGKYHPQTVRSMHNKALVLDYIGKYDEALFIYNQVIEVEGEMLGDDHPDTLTSMQNKATVLLHEGKYDGALSIYNYVIDVRTQKLGKDHPYTLTSIHNKASVLDEMGKYKEALGIYNHLIEVKQEKLAKDHPSTVTSMHKKASILSKMGKYDEALSMYSHIIKVRTEKLGKDHPDTLASLHNKATVLYKIGEYDESLKIFNHVIEVSTEKIGKDHPDTLITVHNKAKLLDKMGKYKIGIIKTKFKNFFVSGRDDKQ